MKETARFAGLLLPESERSQLLERIRPLLSEADFQLIEQLVRAVPEVLGLLEQRGMSIERLRKIAFGAATEKTATVLPPAEEAARLAEEPATQERRRPGHGRHAAGHYTGARRVPVPHPTLRPSQACPSCQQGKLRAQRKPAAALRVQAQPPITAQVYEAAVLRCDLCGKTFTAPLPVAAGLEKYDRSVGVMAALLRYGSGMPAYRLAQFQGSLGVPLPASTQWELVDATAVWLHPVWAALQEVAAQAPLLHNDDTTMRVSDLRRQIQHQPAGGRTGIFTTGVVAEAGPSRIALFFTGRQHAGENLDQLLRHRQPGLPAPVHMCDGLSRNESAEFDTLLACCLAHGRRGFVEVATRFPEECRQVLESLRAVYRVDAQAKREALSPEQRLRFHQTHSQPVMEELKTWLRQQIDEKRVEPNSGLGDAIDYLLKHWEPLTLFLRVAGAPLDNNLCERALKMAILHRKNSLSYKTERGAQVGDLFMSLIHTCRLNAVNPFDYLIAVVRHSQSVQATPHQWLPWNYREALQKLQPVPENTG